MEPNTEPNSIDPDSNVVPTPSSDPNPTPPLPPSPTPTPIPSSDPSPVLDPTPTQEPTLPETTVPGQVIHGGFDPSAASPMTGSSEPPSPTTAAPSGPVVGGTDPLAAVSTPSPRRSLKPFLIVLAVVLVVGIGSAAAYVGIILPNKPINVLKQSLANSLQEPQSSFKGSLNTDAASSGGVAYKANFSGATDAPAKAAEFKLDFTVTGITFPIEARLVNKNVYVKAGDLSTVANLIAAYSPEFGSLANTLSSQLSNKWIVIDSTLLDQSGTGCFLDTSWSVTNADVQLLNKAYDKHAFVTVKNTGTDSVDGQKAEKFVLSIDDDKLAAYGNEKTLDNLSLVKTTQKCDKNAAKNVSNAKGDHKQTPLTVWVDKGKKRIVKIAYQDPAKKNGSVAVTINYNKVSITAPANAEPAVQVITDIENSAKSNPALLNLFSGSSSTGTSGSSLPQ